MCSIIEKRYGVPRDVCKEEDLCQKRTWTERKENSRKENERKLLRGHDTVRGAECSQDVVCHSMLITYSIVYSLLCDTSPQRSILRPRQRGFESHENDDPTTAALIDCTPKAIRPQGLMYYGHLCSPSTRRRMTECST